MFDNQQPNFAACILQLLQLAGIRQHTSQMQLQQDIVWDQVGDTIIVINLVRLSEELSLRGIKVATPELLTRLYKRGWAYEGITDKDQIFLKHPVLRRGNTKEQWQRYERDCQLLSDMPQEAAVYDEEAYPTERLPKSSSSNELNVSNSMVWFNLNANESAAVGELESYSLMQLAPNRYEELRNRQDNSPQQQESVVEPDHEHSGQTEYHGNKRRKAHQRQSHNLPNETEMSQLQKQEAGVEYDVKRELTFEVFPVLSNQVKVKQHNEKIATMPRRSGRQADNTAVVGVKEQYNTGVQDLSGSAPGNEGKYQSLLLRPSILSFDPCSQKRDAALVESCVNESLRKKYNYVQFTNSISKPNCSCKILDSDEILYTLLKTNLTPLHFCWDAIGTKIIFSSRSGKHIEKALQRKGPQTISYLRHILSKYSFSFESTYNKQTRVTSYQATSPYLNRNSLFKDWQEAAVRKEVAQIKSSSESEKLKYTLKALKENCKAIPLRYTKVSNIGEMADRFNFAAHKLSHICKLFRDLHPSSSEAVHRVVNLVQEIIEITRKPQEFREVRVRQSYIRPGSVKIEQIHKVQRSEEIDEARKLSPQEREPANY